MVSAKVVAVVIAVVATLSALAAVSHPAGVTAPANTSAVADSVVVLGTRITVAPSLITNLNYQNPNLTSTQRST